MEIKRRGLHNLIMNVVFGFAASPLLTWGLVLFFAASASWSWLNLLYPEWFSDLPYVSAVEVILQGVSACMTTLCCWGMVVIYFNRRDLYIQDMGWSLYRDREISPSSDQLEFMMEIAELYNVRGEFCAFLANYPVDAQPTTQVVKDQLDMLIQAVKAREQETAAENI